MDVDSYSQSFNRSELKLLLKYKFSENSMSWSAKLENTYPNPQTNTKNPSNRIFIKMKVPQNTGFREAEYNCMQHFWDFRLIVWSYPYINLHVVK